MMKSNLITFLKSPWLVEFKSHNSFMFLLIDWMSKFIFQIFFVVVKRLTRDKKLLKKKFKCICQKLDDLQSQNTKLKVVLKYQNIQ